MLTFDGRHNGYLPGEPLSISPSLALHDEMVDDVDPITYEVIRANLWNINLEHGEAIKRTSGSPVVIWTDDFNQSIQTEDGDPVCFGPTIQWFGGMADLAVKWTLENRSDNPGIDDGDVFLQNDPYIGSNHQMDVSLFAPVFIDDRLFAWVYNCCHEADVGGVEPGSFVPQAQDIFWESTPVPPIKLVEGGVIRHDVEDAFLRKSRFPDMAALELRSQIAGINVARDRLIALVERYDPATVKTVMRRMVESSRATVAARLQSLPDGTWQDVTYFSGSLPDDRRLHRVVLTMEKRGSTLRFSNLGTDPQFGPTNCAAGAWRGGILTGLMPMLAYDQYFCTGGVLQCLEFVPTPGVITSCTYPAATTGMGISSVVHQTVQVVGKLLATTPRSRRQILGIGGPHTLVAARLNATGRNGQFVQASASAVMASGLGAFSFRDGIAQGGTYVAPRSRISDVETYERDAPILFLYRKEIDGGGGHGKWRGGAGVEDAIVTDPPRSMSATTFGIASVLPLGAGRFGGYHGSAGGIFHMERTRVREQLASGTIPSRRSEIDSPRGPGVLAPPKCVGIPIGPDDVWITVGGSGSGYGDPLLRDPSDVVRDVAIGRLASSDAERIYGVALSDDSFDSEATRAMRARRRVDRLEEAGATGPIRDVSPLAEDDGVVLVGESLGVRVGPRAEYVCAACGGRLADTTGNYKDGCSTLDTTLNRLDPSHFEPTKLQVDEDVVYRQFLCRHCGTILDACLCRPSDPPVWDVRIDAESLRLPGVDPRRSAPSADEAVAV